MKLLKLKSILFSITAVTLISAFLTSCEKDFVSTDVPLQSEISEQKEDQNDLNQLESFQNMVFSKMEVPVLGVGGFTDNSNVVELNGKLVVSERGNVSGKVLVNSTDNLINGVVSFDNQIISYSRNGETVQFDPTNAESLVVSGINKKDATINTFDILDKIADFKSQKTETFSIEMQALSAYYAILSSSPWVANTEYATSNGNSFKMACSWWQLAAISTASYAIVAIGAVGCATICAIGTTITLGGLAIPCVWAVTACGIAAYGGSQAVYHYLVQKFCY